MIAARERAADSVAETARRTRRRAIIVAGGVPVVVALAAAITMITWLPDLPGTVAVHWGNDGPDEFGSPWLSIILTFVLPVAYSAFAVSSAAKPTPAGLLGANQKVILVAGVWLAVMLGVSAAGSLFVQRGLADATDAGAITLPMLLGVGLGIVCAAGAWVLLPATDASSRPSTSPRPIEATATERLSWSRTVSLRGGVLVLAVGAVVAAAIATVLAAVFAREGVWIIGAVFIVLLVAALTTTRWRVTADHRGLLVRGGLGWPRVTIAPSDIREVRVVDVDPAADFGGWGWRTDTTGRTGVVMQAGSAIEVTRASGKRFIVTVDDAETGAGVIAAFIR